MDAAAAGKRAQRAVYVLHFPETPFLNDAERDVLWEAFQVPAFALLLDGEGRLVGYECEAQDGLHVKAAFPTAQDQGLVFDRDDSVLGYRVPLAEAIVETPCECGRPGRRLKFAGSRASPRRLEVVAPRNQMVVA